MKLFAASTITGFIAMLVAQLPVGEESPGWVNALLNGGALAILAYLAFRGLPWLYGQIKEDRVSATEEIRKDRHDDRNAQQSTLLAYQAETKYEREQAERHFTAVMHALQDNQRATMQTLSGLEKTLNVLATVIQRGNRGQWPLKPETEGEA